MADPYSSGPGYVVYDLIPSGAESTQLSADETKIYVAMNNGQLRVYDIASQTLLQTFNVAAQLGSMTINDAGTTAYVIGKATANGANAIYQVNLATGASSVLPNTQALGATDIEWIAGNKLIVSASQTWLYNLATQQASAPTGNNPLGFFSNSIMVESDGLVLIAETNTSAGALQLYDETTGTILGYGDSNQGGSPSGFNYGSQAVSREGGLIAQFIYFEAIEIYDLSLKLVTSLIGIGNYSGGLAFDSQGDFLLAYQPGSGRLTAFSTDTWNSALIIDVRPASTFYDDGGNGDAIKITSNDSYIILTDMLDGHVQIVALTAPIGSNTGVVGSNGDDNLVAVGGQDVDGRDGVDSLSISFIDSTAGVTADFSQLETSNPITIEGATISNIENIAAIEGSNFADVLTIYQLSPNGGGSVSGNDGDDEIYVVGSVGLFGVQIGGGAGNDLLDGRASQSGGVYAGEAGDDTIYTGPYSNSLGLGGDGNDTIHSWDQAYGEAGDDTIFLYDPVNVSGARPLGNGGEGNDTISGVDNTGGRSPVDFQLLGGPGSDTLNGGSGNDYLNGAEGDSDSGLEKDYLYGGGGQDTLIAGLGDDVDGGDGFDNLYLSLAAASSGVTLDTDDFIGSTPVNVLGGLISNVEYVRELIATNFNDTITIGTQAIAPQGSINIDGLAGNDTFYDNGAIAFINGNTGNDSLISGATSGAAFYGGEGTDTADYRNYAVGIIATLTGNGFDDWGKGPEGQNLYGVEILFGSEFEDKLTGNIYANELHGGGGNDLLEGNFGDDLLDGGTGTDEVTYISALDFGVTVSLSVTGPQNTGFGMDTLVGIENLTGTNFADMLTGDAGTNVIRGGNGNDTIDGRAGQDHMYGGAGNDTYYVNQQDDLIYEDVGAGTDSVLSGASFYLYENVENLTLTGTADLFGVGNALANVIRGNDGSNLLLGGGGVDTLYGGDGNDALFGEDGDDDLLGDDGIDYLVGGAGNDSLWGNLGPDALYGGDGDDTLNADSLTVGDGIVIQYHDAPAPPPPAKDFVTDILVGGAGNDTLIAASGLGDYDLLYGGDGDDTYRVDTGDDLTFEGENAGIDTVIANVPGENNGVYLYANVENLVLLNTTAFGVGNELANTMTGSASANWLLGGAGNDTINGKGGNDVLFGEAGADTFIFEQGTGGDVIGDFTSGEDVIDLQAFGIASFDALKGAFIQNGDVGAINLGNGDFIVLHNVQMDQLTDADFML